MRQAVPPHRTVARRALAASLALALAALSLSAAGCGSTSEPVSVTREALGTTVTITAWGSDDEALRTAIEQSFGDMAEVAAQLDAYDDQSDTAAINKSPGEWHRLPPDAVDIVVRTRQLEVERHFSSTLFGVSALYGFSGKPSVPTTRQIDDAVAASRTLLREGDMVRFDISDATSATASPAGPPPGQPGFDFGGAAKGLALDRVLAELRKTRGIEAVIITSMSSTVTWGRKPGAEPWRIGIEDPRATGTILAVVTSDDEAPLNVSTSGDYQRSFERDGVRYHHILDPATGRPARGMRSLTVFGRISGLDADILSTALFVAGKTEALAYAKRHGIGLYLVDDEGKAVSYVPPDLDGVGLEKQAEPKR